MLAKRIIPCIDVRNRKVVNGVNIEGIAMGGKCGFTTSGGVHDIEDIRVCKKMRLYVVICGKSIYSGSLDLVEAVKYAECGD